MVSFLQSLRGEKERTCVPTRIGADICTAPDFNLTDCDIENFMDEMTTYVEKFESAFQRVEQLEWGKNYLQGLLGEAPRKNIERIALEQGEKVRSMQHFIGQSPWEQEPAIAIHQQLLGETLGEEDGIARAIDESSVVKQGDGLVGVAAE
jgi:SRSO17 transposase